MWLLMTPKGQLDMKILVLFDFMYSLDGPSEEMCGNVVLI